MNQSKQESYWGKALFEGIEKPSNGYKDIIEKEMKVWVEMPVKVKIIHEGKEYNPDNVSVLGITPFKDTARICCGVG